jgi:membrane-bound metal-dependent hydrolase YbcI (DUF457 family)
VPSPVGHALGGIALGWHLVPRRNRYAAIVLAGIAIAPDLDLLIGDHRGISHSVGAAAVAGLIALAVTRSPRWSLAVAIAYASHVLFDWLSNDTRPPIGVMALWPFTSDYYKASVEIFPPVSRRYWESRFWLYNLRAVVMELLILGPVVLLAVFWKRIAQRSLTRPAVRNRR